MISILINPKMTYWILYILSINLKEPPYQPAYRVISGINYRAINLFPPSLNFCNYTNKLPNRFAYSCLQKTITTFKRYSLCFF